MARISKTKKRAADDLFGVGLDLDVIVWKLGNISEDMEDLQSWREDREDLESIRALVKEASKKTEEIRRKWEHGK